MASTFFGLNIAYTGLQAAQTAINTTAHNIANINTTGYSRQEALTQAANALRTYSSYGTLGSGVVVTAINQIRDSYYDEKYRNNQTNYGEYEVKNSYMSQIENYLNEYALDGISTEYENFFTSVNTVISTSSDQSALNELVNNAKSMADYLNVLSTNLRNIQTTVNSEIKDQVSQINTIAKTVSELNRQINAIECNGGTANDLRDQRNTLVDELSQIVNVDVSEEQTGLTTKYSILINGQTLVSGYNYNELQVVARDENTNASDANGLYDIQWKGGQTFDIYSSTLSGSLKGLIDIRDGNNGEIEQYTTDEDGNTTLETVDASGTTTSYKGIPYYLSQLNQFVQTFTQSVNDILTSGYTTDNEEGVALFTVSTGSDVMSAYSVTVNEDLLDDCTKVAIKSSLTDGSANCDLMSDLYDLQNQKIFDGGTGAYYLESIVTDMSIDASTAASMEQNYTNLSSTIQNQRLSIMGVDADEEAMDLIKFQQAYNLSSKILSVMNEIYDKLINYTGV